MHFKSFRQTSKVVGISKSTIQRWVRDNPVVRKNRMRRKLHDNIIERITELLQQTPFTNPERIANTIKAEFSTTLSASGVRFWMKQSGISLKKATRVVTCPDVEEKRSHFAKEYMSVYDSERVVSIDESSFFFDMKPSKGYCHKSKRLNVSAARGGRARWSLCMAVTNERIVGWKLVKGSFNNKLIADFVETLDTDERDILLLDNASIHTTNLVKDTIIGRGLTPVYLPPYSPQLQPIEHAFSVLKCAFRQQPSNCTTGVLSLQELDVQHRLKDSFVSVSRETLFNQFQACWKRGESMCEQPEVQIHISTNGLLAMSEPPST